MLLLFMIRNLQIKQKEGNMDQAMKQAIETYKTKIIEDYEKFNTGSHKGLYKDTIAQNPEYEKEVMQRANERLEEFKKGLSFVETKYYYKFVKANGTQKSVHSFIVKEDKEIRRKHWKKGDILFCASFNQPALNRPRGNIFGNYIIKWTGPLYLR